MKSEIEKGEDTSLSQLFKKFEAMGYIEIEAGYLSPAPHPESELNMVEIALLQQYGSKAHNIPERPFLTDGAVLAANELSKYWHKVMRDYLIGGKGAAAFEPLARASREGIAKAIAMQRFVPLSSTTLKTRRKRGNTSTTILIDTGHLINGIESKIGRRGRKNNLQ